MRKAHETLEAKASDAKGEPEFGLEQGKDRLLAALSSNFGMKSTHEQSLFRQMTNIPFFIFQFADMVAVQVGVLVEKTLGHSSGRISFEKYSLPVDFVCKGVKRMW